MSLSFYSTHGSPKDRLSLRDAVMNGLAPDGGLYMPHALPKLPSSVWARSQTASFADTANAVAQAIFAQDLPSETIEQMTREAYPFDVPIRQLDEHTFVAELFHGPTLAFKDVAARFMARLMGGFVQAGDEKLTILVATSGDTGSAVGNAFKGISGIDVVILYPKGMVSDAQEAQLTTIGDNVRALRVDGTFDDCQRMVKEAFQSSDIKQLLTLGSANSINIARLLPQMFYYVHAYRQLPKHIRNVAMSVPSGNLGNLTAGMMASSIGFPVNQFVAANNRNNTLYKYLTSGDDSPTQTVPTISNAMDVGLPSNLVRLQSLFAGKREHLAKHLAVSSHTDDETRAMIRETYARFDYVVDPHTAVGLCGLQAFREADPDRAGIVMSTAHPAKFADVVSGQIGKEVVLPLALAAPLKQERQVTDIPNTLEALSGQLLSL